MVKHMDTRLIKSWVCERDVDVVVGPEARGFIIGCPVAYSMGIGFAPVRKEGKLPRGLFVTNIV